MQEGGEVDPPLLDSQSDGTSSEFTLLPQTPNLESDIPEQIDSEGFELQTAPYLWENLDPSFGYEDYITDRYSSDNDILNEVPPPQPTTEDFNQWMAENAPEEIAPPDQLSEVEQMSPLLVNIYNSNVEAYKNNLNARNEAVTNFNEGVVTPYNDWIDGYDSARQRVIRQDLQGRKALEDIRRKSTPESFDEMVNNPVFGAFDLGYLKLREKSGVSFKNPDGVLMTRGDVLLSDLHEGSAEDFSEMIRADIDEQFISDRQDEINSEIDVLNEALEKISNARSGQEASSIVSGLDLTLRDGSTGTVKEKIKELQESSGDSQIIEDQIPLNSRKYFENYVLENVALTEKEWTNETLVSRGVAPDSGVRGAWFWNIQRLHTES